MAPGERAENEHNSKTEKWDKGRDGAQEVFRFRGRMRVCVCVCSTVCGKSTSQTYLKQSGLRWD